MRKVHWLRAPHIWTHGAASGTSGTEDKSRITCKHCLWKAGLGPSLYAGCRAGPTLEPLGPCARRQVLAMVLGLA